MPPEQIAKELGQASKRGYGWMCKCPCHEDDKASLSIYERDGIVRFKCFAGCEEHAVKLALGFHLPHNGTTIVYNYCDESGKVLFHKTRKPGKEFRCVGANGETSLQGIRKPLYMTDKLALSSIHDIVLVVEGEKDVDICIEHDFCAVCNFDGAGKWLAEYSEQLRGRHVLVIPDYDQPGVEHAQLVRDKLKGVATTVSILDARELFAAIGVKKLWKGADIHDWFLRGGTSNHLRQIITSTQKLQDAPDMAQVLMGALTRIERKTCRDGAYSGLETGFSKLDELTDGLQPAEFYVLAARPSVGKTAFALNMAETVLASGLSTVFFSMEMGGEQLGARLLHSMTRIDNRARELSEGDWRALEDAAARVLDSGLIIDDTSPLNITKLRERAHLYHRAEPLSLILIDYIQYMKGAGEATREREIAGVSEGLKTLAKELNCPVVALSQLNRAVEYRKTKRPFLSDLRDSGAIEQDADVVVLMWLDANLGIRCFEVAKNRNGPVGQFKLVYDAGQTRFVDYERKEVSQAEPDFEGIIESEDFLI